MLSKYQGTLMWVEEFKYLKGYTLLRNEADLLQYLRDNKAEDYSFE